MKKFLVTSDRTCEEKRRDQEKKKRNFFIIQQPSLLKIGVEKSNYPLKYGKIWKIKVISRVRKVEKILFRVQELLSQM